MYFLLPDDNPNLTVHRHESFGSVSESLVFLLIIHFWPWVLLHQGPLVFRLFFDRFDTCDRCRGSCRVRLRVVVGTKGSAIRRSMSWLSAAEAEVLFVGKLLGCLIEARDARGCGCLGGILGRESGRYSGGAGRGNWGSIGAREFGFARVGVVELNEILLIQACAFDKLGQCGGGPEVEKLGHEGGRELVAEFGDARTGGLITAKLDIELDPLGQERVNRVVGLHDELFHGSQRNSVLVRVLETIVKQEEG